MKCLELKNISKFYKNQGDVTVGIKDVNLSFSLGEFVAITGESGSGKSTLLNIIAGLDSCDAGELVLFDEKIDSNIKDNYEKCNIDYVAYISQDYNLVNSYTVYQNIELALLFSGEKKNDFKKKINMLIDLVGLKGFERKKVSKLSGGQKQRVAIARAIAEDKPIIVADELTSNLDEHSSKRIIDLLHKISKNKLIIIATHNYKEVESVATRKITINQGNVLEITENINIVNENLEYESKRKVALGRGTIISLGCRNAFNLPVKFILLFMVFFFISVGVIYQYVAIEDNVNQDNLLGENPIFLCNEANRLIITKDKKETFDSNDYSKINKIEGIKQIVKDDCLLDTIVRISSKYIELEGNIYPISNITSKDITYGRLPKAKNEVLVYVDEMSSSYDTFDEFGDQFIDQKFILHDINYDFPIINGKVKICGIVVDHDSHPRNENGYGRFYVTTSLSTELSKAKQADASKTYIKYNGISFDYDSRTVFPSSRVTSGHAIIFEDASYCYENDDAIGKNVHICSKNQYFNNAIDLKVERVLKPNNCEQYMGFNKDYYDLYNSYIFINPDDYNKLYKMDSYQISVFLDEENLLNDVKSKLLESGYRVFPIKDSLSDVTGGYDFFIEFFSLSAMFIEYIVILFLSYKIISMVMGTRKKYYLLLRTLGARNKDIRHVINVELFAIMCIAYLMILIFAFCISNDFLDFSYLKMQLNYIKYFDYILLYGLLIFMVYFVSAKFTKYIFSKNIVEVSP